MHASIHSEFTGIARHSRTEWLYGLLRDLPGDRLFCHRRLADEGFVRPGSAERASARLDASIEPSGPHDLMSSRFFGLVKTSKVPENFRAGTSSWSFHSSSMDIDFKSLPLTPASVPRTQNFTVLNLCRVPAAIRFLRNRSRAMSVLVFGISQTQRLGPVSYEVMCHGTPSSQARD
jgi:hypothetical protein